MYFAVVAWEQLQPSWITVVLQSFCLRISPESSAFRDRGTADWNGGPRIPPSIQPSEGVTVQPGTSNGSHGSGSLPIHE